MCAPSCLPPSRTFVDVRPSSGLDETERERMNIVGNRLSS